MDMVVKQYTALVCTTLFFAVTLFTPLTADSDVCSEGTGTPPFLSAGTDPNLLIVIDNSGSMLDMAYIDEDSQCFDESFLLDENDVLDTSIIYGGYFTADKWYKWNNGAGYFEEDSSGTPCASLSYTTTNVKVTFTDGVGTLINDVTVTTPEAVSCFAATGNFLNWASASKFDIEKKVLIGGKYESGKLISENRGCAGKGFIKQVMLDGASNVKMTLRVAPTSDTDDTTTISILGAQAGGMDPSACDAAFDKLLEVGTGYQNDVDNCLGLGATSNERAALNHSLQFCWKADTENLRDVTTVIGDCESLYNDIGYSPATIDPFNGGYNCYGVYDEDLAHDVDREGYVGRCWQLATGAGTCIHPTCGCPGGIYPCFDYDKLGAGKWFQCATDQKIYRCDFNFNEVHETCNKPWSALFLDSTMFPVAVECIPAVGPTVDDWGGDLDGDPLTLNDDPSLYGDGSYTSIEEACVTEAMIDYCGDLKVPEVIDPSDEASVTDDFWNIPATLIDSGAYGQYGIDVPLLTMTGEILEGSQPQGILHEYASELRIGIMAFNDNGSKTECDPLLTDVNDTVVEHCPATNKDGAAILPLSSIKLGSEVISPGVQHVDNLTTAISNIQAVAWTPLSEAVYNALGYFGQNPAMRLDGLVGGVDFVTEAEGGPTDPVQFWCQENIIMIITEGASTADINPDIADFVTVTMPADGYNDGDAAASETECLDINNDHHLYGSTYLDDLTYWGRNADVDDLYTTPTLTVDGITHDKKKVSTYIVTTGTLRTDGAGECSPATLMANAAANGAPLMDDGSPQPPYEGANPLDLQNNLENLFRNILSRVSAGSAASVISSTRSGAGAVYQAIFWPDLTDAANNEISWVGDVHSLFLDSLGSLYEDTPDGFGVQDRKLDTSVDQRVLFFYDQSVDPARTRACSGTLTTPEDTNNNGVLDTEDANCNGTLDAGEDLDGDLALDTEDTNGNCILDYACSGTVREIGEVNYVWSVSAPNANGWLTDNTIDPLTQRTWLVDDILYPDDSPERYIFTWSDLNKDGIVGSNEQVDFTYAALTGINGSVSPDRGSVMEDFAVADTYEWERVIGWIRGQDQPAEILDDNGNGSLDPAMRSRLYNGATWRLGDVIHSTPTLVGRPVEAYHFVYHDPTYALFAKKYSNRRNMVYFGANDGMLHAINAGYYVQKEQKFCLTAERDADGNCDTGDEANKPLLGAELWAYVPYNLHPHLKCLTDPDYVNSHKYYVDQRPRVFDVQIFPDDCTYTYDAAVPQWNTDCSDATHPGGWGTILVGSLRFGGAPVKAYPDLNSNSNDDREFISSYFILDITDPENPPNLLAEMTMTVDGAGNPDFADMGYSTVVPAMNVMRDENGKTKWYLVLGNGPATTKGENDQQGKVAVFPLAWLNGDVDNWFDPVSVDPPTLPDLPEDSPLFGPYRLLSVDSTTRKPFQIPQIDLDAAVSGEGGIFPIPACPDYDGDTVADCLESSTSDLVSVDFDIENPSIANIGAAYKTDAIYFGTTDGTGFSSAFPGCTASKCWDGGGRMYRLVTKKYDTADNDLDGDTTEEIISEPWEWHLSKMLDAHAPISAAASLGYDNRNFWVYFGTGRFLDKNDKPDDQAQRMFALIEPRNCDNQQTWPTVNWWVGPPPYAGKSPDPTQSSGDRGLMQVDPILVELGATGVLHCVDGTTNCRQDHSGTALTNFAGLTKYIIGEADCAQANPNPDIGLDGWFREFPDDRERNLGQATLLGGLLTYTTYKPYQDVCKAEGESFLYGVHYQTGTAWRKSVFGTYDFMGSTIVKDRLSLGTGLALTPSLHVGTGDADATAFVQTSTGEILEIAQEELPLGNFKSGRSSWRQE